LKNHYFQQEKLLLLLGGLALILGASCTHLMPPAPKATATSVLRIAPIFREFYEYLGGSQVLGQPISQQKLEGNTTVQYLEKAKLVFDNTASAKKRFSLAPVGSKMGVVQPTLPPPENAGPYYYDGHYIPTEFLPLYEKLAVFAGRPVTEAVYNPIRNRYEQFFENVGFYRLEGDHQVYLLDYGRWACGAACEVAQSPADATIDVYTQVDETFTPLVARLGGDFTGFALSSAYLNQDGMWEQIFSNVVLRANAASDPSHVELRPLTQDLKILPEQPRAYSNSLASFFYPISGNKGFEVPDYFWDYITARGGIEISGAPVSHLAPLKGAVMHQCFVNLCLMYDPQASEQSRVRPEPLGYAYKALNRPGPAAPQANKTVTPLQIKVWERYAVIPSGQSQEIGVSVMENGHPLKGAKPYLRVTLPDGKQKTYILPATSADGISGRTLEPIHAAIGTLILYKVCLPQANRSETCVGDSFVVWNNP
jgi:hypothetical protein